MTIVTLVRCADLVVILIDYPRGYAEVHHGVLYCLPGLFDYKQKAAHILPLLLSLSPGFTEQLPPTHPTGLKNEVIIKSAPKR